MHRIVWDKGCISMITNSIDADVHKHWMLQLFYTPNESMKLTVEGKPVEGRMVLVNTDVNHTFQTDDTVHFSMLIVPGCELCEHLEHAFLKGQSYFDFSDMPLTEFESAFKALLKNTGKEEYLSLKKAFYDVIKLEECVHSHEQLERVQKITSLLEEDHSLSLDELSARLFLSPSRLAHVFKAATGVPLKNYLVIHKCFTAIKAVFNGKSITEAAMDGGFDSPSHLAYSMKKFTGTSTTDATKDSEFLKVD